MPVYNRKISILLQKYALIILSLIFWATIPVYATHNLAGQITYEKVADNTFEFTITTYTDPTDQGVDRCTLDLIIYDMSNNIVEELLAVPRINGPIIGPIGI